MVNALFEFKNSIVSWLFLFRLCSFKNRRGPCSSDGSGSDFPGIGRVRYFIIFSGRVRVSSSVLTGGYRVIRVIYDTTLLLLQPKITDLVSENRTKTWQFEV